MLLNTPVISHSRPDLGVSCSEATRNLRAAVLPLGTFLIHMIVLDLKKDGTYLPEGSRYDLSRLRV